MFRDKSYIMLKLNTELGNRYESVERQAFHLAFHLTARLQRIREPYNLKLEKQKLLYNILLQFLEMSAKSVSTFKNGSNLNVS